MRNGESCGAAPPLIVARCAFYFAFRILHSAFFILLLCSSPAAAQAPAALQLPRYETRYYTVYTDLPPDDAREAALRMTVMAEEYALRTRDFAARINSRMPFFLHAKLADYIANGGPEGTDGFFDGSRLVAFGGRAGARSWSTVQHEGFHQFAHKVIGQNLPAWVDEGLAEYFGEAIFTGDGYTSGIAPAWRIKRVKQRFAAGAFSPTAQLIQWDTGQWNQRLDLAHYDHAWTMVHFLAHAAGGKYRNAFAAYINDVAGGRDKSAAWERHFGPVEQFDRAWRQWWMELPEDVSERQYVAACTAMLTSYLARAASQKQSFADFEAFLAAVSAQQVRFHPEDWLPKSLAEAAVERATDDARRLGLSWSLASQGRSPTVVCTFKDGSQLIGRFTLKGDRVGEVSVADRKAASKAR